MAMFAYPSLTKTQDKPFYSQLYKVQKEMNANTVAILPNLSCRNFGFLAPKMALAPWGVVSITPIHTPVNLCAQPNLNGAATTYVTIQAYRRHRKGH